MVGLFARISLENKDVLHDIQDDIQVRDGTVVSFHVASIDINACLYLQYPVELMSPVPDDRFYGLSVFQKCLLWRIMAPHKVRKNWIVVCGNGMLRHSRYHLDISGW